jgi:hypothetical protein
MSISGRALTRDNSLSRDNTLSPTKGEGPLGATLSPTINYQNDKFVGQDRHANGQSVGKLKVLGQFPAFAASILHLSSFVTIPSTVHLIRATVC